MNLKKLAEPFSSDDVEWRVGRVWKYRGLNATVLAYVTNRAIQQRLDEVIGPLSWRNEFKEWHGKAQLCGISIYDEEKQEWVTKWDGAEDTNFEATKGGLSDAMKRAGYQWGIGRYLYDLPEMKADVSEEEKPGYKYGKSKLHDGTEIKYWWQPPELPQWALPQKPQGDRTPRPPQDTITTGFSDEEVCTEEMVTELLNAATEARVDMKRFEAWLHDTYGYTYKDNMLSWQEIKKKDHGPILRAIEKAAKKRGRKPKETG
jgi:hypothetical protein